MKIFSAFGFNKFTVVIHGVSEKIGSTKFTFMYENYQIAELTVFNDSIYGEIDYTFLPLGNDEYTKIEQLFTLFFEMSKNPINLALSIRENQTAKGFKDYCNAFYNIFPITSKSIYKYFEKDKTIKFHKQYK